jgi:hypothetical protein
MRCSHGSGHVLLAVRHDPLAPRRRTACVNAVLVEGRSTREVAATTGRSKSWVHRHSGLYRQGGAEAGPPLAGSEDTGEPDVGAERGRDRGATKAPQRRRSRRRGSDHRVAPQARGSPRAGGSSTATDPAPPRLRDTAAQKRPRSSWTRFESDLPNKTWPRGVSRARRSLGKSSEPLPE